MLDYVTSLDVYIDSFNQSKHVFHLEEEEQCHTRYSVLLMCQWLLKYSHGSFTNTRSVLARPKEFEGAEWPTRSAWLLTRGKVGGGSANACMQEQATLQPSRVLGTSRVE